MIPIPRIYWRSEGEAVRFGLNLYPLDDPGSFGGILALGPLHFKARWSKFRKRWRISTEISQ